jgi:NAD-reducing hydrogenase small subunit
MARKLKVATVTLAGCFGCHMSLLDLDERLIELAQHVELVRSPLTDLRRRGRYDVCLIEGGLCNAENVQVLQELRARSDLVIAVGACAIFGGIPALRNRYPLADCLRESYVSGPGLVDPQVPGDVELPRLLDQVVPIHSVVSVDFSIPGCPPPAEAFWRVMHQLIAGQPLSLPSDLVRYD